MRILYQKFETLLQHTPTEFKRYLYDRISWDSRMLVIIGPRDVGKTTMILQYIKENLDSKKALYESADDLYFSEHRLIDLLDNTNIIFNLVGDKSDIGDLRETFFSIKCV